MVNIITYKYINTHRCIDTHACAHTHIYTNIRTQIECIYKNALTYKIDSLEKFLLNTLNFKMYERLKK